MGKIGGIVPFNRGSGFRMSPDAAIYVGDETRPRNMTQKQLTAMPAGRSHFTSSDLGATLGHEVVLWSTDIIPDVAQHSSTWLPYSQEQFEIHSITSSGAYELAMNTADPYTLNQWCADAEPHMHDNFIMRDLQVEYDGQDRNGTARKFFFYNLRSFDISGNNFGPVAPGGVMQVVGCADGRIHNNKFGNTANWWETVAGHGYHIVLCGGRDVLVYSNSASGGRHFVTTASQESGSGPNWRAGTSRGMKIMNNLCHGAGASGTPTASVGALAPLDTHAESWGTEFTGNTVYLSSADSWNRAFNIRSRHTIIRNNVVSGPANYYFGDNSTRADILGGRIFSSYNVIEGNQFNDVLTGLWIENSYNHVPMQNEIVNNTFSNTSGPGLRLRDCKQTLVSQNTFNNYARLNTSSQDVAIEINTAAVPGQHQITGNSMPRNTSAHVNQRQAGTVYLEGGDATQAGTFTGNDCAGWGDGTIGATGPAGGIYESIWGANERNTTAPQI